MDEHELAVKIIEIVPYLSRSLSAVVRDELEEPITISQLRVLAYLRRHPGASLGDLAQWRDVSLPTMSKMVRTLVERGWVYRTTAPHNRRLLVLTLTPTGEALYLDILARLERRVAQMILRRLSPNRRGHVAEVLECLAEVFADVGEVRQTLPLIRPVDDRD
ncbi:MAG: MarR family transcriptional regulator [Ardenticatenia bacterium]|nr:MarR family transcriptional regulator [Ardenticatenia bacterium]